MASAGVKKLAARVSEQAWSYPEVTEDHPWGESAFKVKKKTFVFMRATPDLVSFSCKLPFSRDFALSFGFAEPTGYGLGKSGWVTFRIDAETTYDWKVFQAFIAESYRAVAPKKLVASL